MSRNGARTLLLRDRYLRAEHSPVRGPMLREDGVDPGYHADMLYCPDPDLIVVLYANASQGTADITYERLITIVVQVAVAAVRENRRQGRHLN